MKYIAFFMLCVSSAMISSNPGSPAQIKVLDPWVLDMALWKTQLIKLHLQIQSQSEDIKKLLKKSATFKKQKADLALQANLAQKISNKDKRAFAVAKIEKAQTALSFDQMEIEIQLAELHNQIGMEKEELRKLQQELARAQTKENKAQPQNVRLP